MHKISIDFGGTLIKVCIWEPKRGFCFCAFPIKEADVALNYINQYRYDEVVCTGGGSVKYKNLIQSELKCTVELADEIDCLREGLLFLLEHSNFYSFESGPTKDWSAVNIEHKEVEFPCLIVNIGTGTSILRVDSRDSCTRIGGTALGGGTFYALCSLLNPGLSYVEVLRLALKGVAANVDMTVGDIYGECIPPDLCLGADSLASTLGKLNRDKEVSPKTTDVFASLLEMICYNTCHLAIMSQSAQPSKRIIFTGSFVGNYEHVQHLIAKWMNQLNPTIKCGFVEYSEFVGCVGALFHKLPIVTEPDKDSSKFLFRRKVI